MNRSIALALIVTACTSTEEAVRVDLPVSTAGTSFAAAATDLGYDVVVERMEIAVSGIQFTIEGEQHTDLAPPGTIAHPGHSAGGEVTGELPGDFVLRWTGQTQPSLGMATMIVGYYLGANFSFRAATSADAPAGDPLIGHAIHLAGTVTKAGVSKPFDALLDVEPDTNVFGAVFEHEVTEASAETLGFVFFPTDPSEHDTPFDGVDFFTTFPGVGIEIRPGSATHNIIRRAIQTHDHYGVVPQ